MRWSNPNEARAGTRFFMEKVMHETSQNGPTGPSEYAARYIFESPYGQPLRVATMRIKSVRDEFTLP
jgi:hypothetical protein